MSKHVNGCVAWAAGIITIIFTLTPESLFGKIYIWNSLVNKIDMIGDFSYEINIILNRIILGIIVFCVVFAISKLRIRTMIKGSNYIMRVEYGNLLKKKKCQKVIPFDECYTTTVGNAPSNIKPKSICGQYLEIHPINDMQQIIDNAGVIPEQERSEYQNLVRYKSGTLVPYNNDLLLAFAPLNESGNGEFDSYTEYLSCLTYLWEEINKNYSHQDVSIPILGSSGLTRIPDDSLDQQKLLDIMIESYKLSPYKIDRKLRIICRRRNGFSLNKIGKSL